MFCILLFHLLTIKWFRISSISLCCYVIPLFQWCLAIAPVFCCVVVFPLFPRCSVFLPVFCGSPMSCRSVGVPFSVVPCFLVPVLYYAFWIFVAFPDFACCFLWKKLTNEKNSGWQYELMRIYDCETLLKIWLRLVENLVIVSFYFII